MRLLLIISLFSFQLKAQTFTLCDDTLHMNDVFTGDVFFSFDSNAILEESIPLLDSISAFVKTHFEYVFEIGVHTDERGDERFCKKLSQGRANVVMNYLKENEINTERLIAKGYGENQPIVKHAKTEEEHALNRRTELKVTGYSNFLYDRPNEFLFSDSVFQPDAAYTTRLFRDHSPSILSENYLFLDSLISILIKNSQLQVEFTSYVCNNVLDSERDTELSQMRCENLKLYLLENGIETSRISLNTMGSNHNYVQHDEMDSLCNRNLKKARRINNREEIRLMW